MTESTSSISLVQIRRPTVSSLIGLVVLALSLAIIAGWTTQNAFLVQAMGAPPIVLSTALCLGLAAFALAAESALAPSAERACDTLVGGLIALLTVLVVIEHFSALDFFFDWPELHRWFDKGNPHPGRMSLPSALGLLATGAVLVLMQRVASLGTGFLVQGLTILIAALGVASAAGWLLSLDWIYPGYLLRRMAPASAVGMIALAIGLWLRWRRMDWYRSRQLIDDEGRRISLKGAGVLVLVASAALLAGFSVVARQLDEVGRKNLLAVLKARVDMFRIVIDLRTTRAAMIATPAHTALLQRLAAHPSDAATLAQLRAAAESFLPLGFSAVALHGQDDHPLISVGRFVEKAELALPLGRRWGVLMWSDGFVLRTVIPLRIDRSSLGTLIAEQRLHLLTRAIEYSYDFAATGDVSVCGRRAERLWCFPLHSEGNAFNVAYDPTLPAARALDGETAARVSQDHRGVKILAAHAPIGAFDLAMVVREDAAEAYAPLRAQMSAGLGMLAILVAAGTLLLYWRVAPLARQLFLNEQRLKLALESSRSAVWDLDLKTNTVYLGAQWSALLGGPAQPTSATLEELYKLVHPDDVSNVRRRVRAALRSDAVTYDVEHRVRTPSGRWAWIHSVGRVVERDREGMALRVIGVNTDIGRRKEAETLDERRARHDEATGLPNRVVFNDRLQTAMTRSRRAPPDRSLLALLFVRIEGLKRIEQDFGPTAAEALLKELARRFRQCTRATDTVARMGADEFAVILEELGLTDQGIRSAEKLIAATEQEIVLERHTLHVNAAVGIAFYDGVIEVNAEQLVRKAHHAMYDASNEGVNRWRRAN